MMTKPDHKTDAIAPKFEGVLIKLADTDERLTNTEIAALSLASPEELVVFDLYWLETSAERKAQALGRMLELAEDDANLDFSPLYRQMLKDDLAAVRAEAVRGLWETEDPSLIRKLVPIMESDPDNGVRAAAAQGLGKFAMLAEHGKLSRELRNVLLGKLLGVFNDMGEESEVRRRALEAAAYFSDPAVRHAKTQSDT